MRKLFPRHLKVLASANGHGCLNYLGQRTGVVSVGEVANELLKAGYLRIRKRSYYNKERGYYEKWAGTYERTPKGDKIVGKDSW